MMSGHTIQSNEMETIIMPDVIIHGFATSNNIKVRVALGYKEIPYTFKTMYPQHQELERLRDPGVSSSFWRRVMEETQ